MQPDPAHCRAPRNYLDAAELCALVRDHRRTKAVSDELAKALLKIAGGVWDRYRFTDSKDDFCQDVFLHLIGTPLAKADPKRNLFSYFTTCAVRFGNKLRDKAAGERRRFEAYARDAADGGKPIPGKNPTNRFTAKPTTKEFLWDHFD